jgi:hypothetical protein
MLTGDFADYYANHGAIITGGYFHSADVMEQDSYLEKGGDIDKDKIEKYKKLIGRTGNKYYFLNYIEYSDSGAISMPIHIIRPVPQKEYKNSDKWWSSRRWLSGSWYRLADKKYENKMRDLGFSKEEYPVIEDVSWSYDIPNKLDEIYDQRLLDKIKKVSEQIVRWRKERGFN